MNQYQTLPCGWSFALLKQVIKKLVDGSHNPPPKQERGFPMLSARNIENGQINFNDYRFIEKKAFEIEDKRTQVRPGDVLLTIVGAIGRTATVPDNIPLFTLQRSVAVLSPLGMIPDFLMYQLQSPQVQKELLKEAKGTAQKGIYLKQLGDIPVLLPPLNEQRRIVAKIEALKARSQRVKEELEDIPQLLDQFRQSVLAAAFRGDLTADWREQNPDVEPAEVLLERIRAERRRRWEEAELEKMKASGKTPKDDKWKEKYEEPPTPDMINLPPLIGNWTYSFLKPFLSQKRTGLKTGPFGSLLKKDDYRTYGIPVLGIENISSTGFINRNKIYIDEVKAKEIADYDAQEKDILISRSGTVGEVCVVPHGIGEARISTNLIRVSLAENYMLPDYFCFLFRGSPFILNQVSELCSGSTRDFLNQTILSSLVFPIPPLEEQKEIVRRVKQLVEFSEKIEYQVTEKTQLLELLNQSILAKAFRGELVPQDPDDEPASVLLECIRAERAKLQTKTAKKSTLRLGSVTTTKTSARRTKKTQPQQEESVQLDLGLE
ncbi:restriction endonuclease subunit S [Nostoc sp. CCY0012]|uniref:restriction endonuclease subunit S n=1 Tax=Nostoc sp. CCY0012 TaxID=1056123 RepID=UPI0039C6603B